MGRAETMARNVIEAAERTALIDPPPSGIGGEIRIVTIGGGVRAETF